MDFSGVTKDTAQQVSETIRFILLLDISPESRQRRIAEVIQAIGSYFHNQLYSASSQIFDSDIMKTSGLDNADGQTQRLANKIMRNYALNRNTVDSLVLEYYNTVLGKAEHEAFSNALSMQKHPTLLRQANRGRPDCEWCKSKEGSYTNPKPDDFARHDECDCLLTVSGFNSRNGLLTNYVKRSVK